MRLRLGATLSLLTLLCASASSARAGCSAHYLASQARVVADADAFDPGALSLGGSALPDQDESTPSRPAPCTGAFCSGNPGVPSSTAPPSLAGGGSHWAVALCSPVLDAPGPLVRAREDARFVAVDQPSSIFHPPRRPSA